MVQGKNYENFAVNYLEPYFTERINADIDNIVKYNSDVRSVLGKSKQATKVIKSKPFNCPHCKVKLTTIADLKMHIKSSHSKVVMKNQVKQKNNRIMDEGTSLLNDTDTNMLSLEEHPEDYRETDKVDCDKEVITDETTAKKAEMKPTKSD